MYNFLSEYLKKCEYIKDKKEKLNYTSNTLKYGFTTML